MSDKEHSQRSVNNTLIKWTVSRDKKSIFVNRGATGNNKKVCNKESKMEQIWKLF